MSGKCPFHFFNRRDFLKSGGLGLLAASAGFKSLAPGVAQATGAPVPAAPVPAAVNTTAYEFWGNHQGGITTPQQAHSYFASFEITAKKKSDVSQLLKEWTEASAKMTQGLAVEIPLHKTPETAKDDGYENLSRIDSGEARGLKPAKLTVTFGFGRGLFVSKDGKDRYGLRKQCPAALIDLPKFHGDQLIEAQSDGDLSIQACSDDPQVAFHAVRQLARIGGERAQIRWVQAGFMSGGANASDETPRNLMGFKDGTQQPKPSEWDKFVWAGHEGPKWMVNGSYMVTRKIRIALEHWDRSEVDFQEQVIGRSKDSGAPLGQKQERETLNLAANDKDGNPVIPTNSHVRLATAATNDGAQILRRGYSYNDGVNFTAERWPPWRQGLEYDAGLFFVSYQTDPRTGFIKIFQNMAKLDALNQFVTHVGSGVFACPPGAKKGEYIGQKLFEQT